MPEIKLSKRLEKILELVSDCECLADIGTDHAFLPIMAVKTGKAKKAILTDINKGPLEKAEQNILLYKQDRTKFSLRQGNGLMPLNDESPDIIAICGMGGNLIVDILKTDENIAKKAKKLILAPNTCWDALRRYLYTNGYAIKNEKTLAEDNHPYLIIEAVFDGNPREIDDCYLGEFIAEMDDGYKALLINKSKIVLENTESDFHRSVIEKLGGK